ncbi:putative uncharacterized protein DDB_G0282133 [Ctenocephalides felis]|uniref:putative uncharacterized protein DDB_G0282133 n=1 Tax=Ctenocephalides felis TaxID=7515 RepID=UPI000E6E28EC|nr:putative uncharacterized protein DDB_G0282133 [Ctenocephalides felis]
MNVTNVNIVHQNCTNQIIRNMGDVISKENINDSKYMKMPENHMNASPVENMSKIQVNPIMDKIVTTIDLIESEESKNDANVAVNEKVSDAKCNSEIALATSNENHNSVSQCCNKSDKIDFEQYKVLQAFMTELQSIIQGLYEAKLNDLKTLLCTCCSNSTCSPHERPEDLYLDDAMDYANDSDECSNCDACEATLKETNLSSQCGCVDPSGYPHHTSRKLRNPKCIDARVVYLVERLYEKNPHKLFQQLETQVHNIITNLYNHLETFMKNHNNDTKHSRLFIDLILECYQNLCSAAKRVAPILMQLQRGHLSKFSLTWDLLNRSIYLECIHMKMQPYVLELISQCRQVQTGAKLQRDDLVQRYIKLDGEMTLISAMWYDVSAMIEDYNNDQLVSQDQQKKLDNRYQVLLDLETKHKKLKFHKIKRSNSEPVGMQSQNSNSNFVLTSTCNKCSNVTNAGSSSKTCTYRENCQCFSPDLCISEEVIRVLNKETDGNVDSTNIKASSTARGDIVYLPGDGKKLTSKSNVENKSLLSKDASKVLSNLKLDNSGNLQTIKPTKQFIIPNENLDDINISDCKKHHKAKVLQKIPIHSPTCNSGLNSLSSGENSAPTIAPNVKSNQISSCPKHGKRKLYTPDWESKTSSSAGNVKPEAPHGNKSHTHGHNCCGGEGDGHVHWTPNTHNKGCACCYCSVYDGAPPNTSSPVNRKYNEARERLRGKLNKTKALNTAASKISADVASSDSKVPSRESSCPTSTETRDVNKLLEWIEGATNKQQKDPAKKAEKKARQKLKKLADKEREDEMVITPRSPEPKQMYIAAEPLKVKSQSCSDGMVNIRLLTSDVPRVAVTAVGSSPDKNKLLYTLINGQKIIPESESLKKKKKKGKQDASVSVTNSELPILDEVKTKIKQKKNDKNNQPSINNISKKTDDKIVKSNVKKDSKTSNKSNKENIIETDSSKTSNNSKQKLTNVNLSKIPKCQDKFCQTDDKLSCANEIIVNITNNEKKNSKKDKKQKDKKVVKNIEDNNIKQQKLEATTKLTSNVKDKVTTKNKSAINAKSEKGKFVESLPKASEKYDYDPNSSQEWIEINNKSRSNNNTSKVNSGLNETEKSKKNNKSKKNKNKQDQSQTVNKTLNKAFENLNISRDTTIEITRENMSKLNINNINGAKKTIAKNSNSNNVAANSKIPSGKNNEYSIMDQLNQGIGVERLKLPPGITLTKVDAVTAYANQQRKTLQASNASTLSNAPKMQEYAMIIANPVQAPPTKDDGKVHVVPSAVTTGTKSSRKSRRKNKNRALNSENESGSNKTKEPKMITLRNPLFQNNILKLGSNSSDQYSAVQPELPYNPIPMPKQASITQNKDGMFTIRSPALQHAMSTGATNFRPHPYSEIPSQDAEHFSYFSNAESSNLVDHYPNENIKLVENNSTQATNQQFVNRNILQDISYEICAQNNDVSNKNDSGFRSYTSFGNQHSPNSNSVGTDGDNFSYFSQSSQNSLQEASMHNNQVNDNNRFCSSSSSSNMNQQPFSHSFSHNYLSGQNVQRLNSQVTIHNISDSMYKSSSHDLKENDYGVEITKMPNMQQSYGKYGNIGEELTLTRSHTVNNPVDYQSYPFASFVNGQTNTKARKDSDLVDNIFAPNQMVNLSELESEERDIESFKRFNYYFEPPKNKPKINLNVNDIVVKKKASSASENGSSQNEYVSNLQRYQMNNCSQKKF